MKTIKIFLASSEELTDDRDAFGNLIRRLDRIYEKRGIRIELFEWEDYDAAYNDCRKQDEYNEQIKASDMFLALFHTKAGKFTIEEFNIATEEFKKHASPKVYTYCKDLQAGEQESPELADFKKKLFNEMGHYWSRYNNRDSMQLHFVMQLQLVEASGIVEKLKLENGTIIIDNMPIAKIGNLQFAAGNEAYQKMSDELATLPEKIEKARQRIEKFPDDEDLRDDLQQKIDRFNHLKEEFAQLQKALFETAQRIATMQQKRMSGTLRRAIEAFENGNIEFADALLDEIAHDAEKHIEQLDKQRELVHQDIEALHLQAKITMANSSVPIQERIKITCSIYKKADKWAERSALEKEKYSDLLFDYARFLFDYAFYSDAIEIYIRQIALSEELKSMWLSSSYNNLGAAYYYLGEHLKAIDCYNKSLKTNETYVADEEEAATYLNNIGSVYYSQGNYQEALEYYQKALNIRVNKFGTDHPKTAISYSNIGNYYEKMGDNAKALDYYIKALDIRENVLGLEHPDVASSYMRIGELYLEQAKFSEALKYYSKALGIRKKILGEMHPDTASSYNSIAGYYSYHGDLQQALTYYLKALSIIEAKLGIEHPKTAALYNNIGSIFTHQGNYIKAIEYFSKAKGIKEKILGLNHPDTATTYHSLGSVYREKGDYSKALDYYTKALKIREDVFGMQHSDTSDSYNSIGLVYSSQGRYSQALNYYFKALSIREKIYGKDNPTTATMYHNIGCVYECQNNLSNALNYYSKALDIDKQILGENHPVTADCYNNVGVLYYKFGNIDRALYFYQKALNIRESVLGLKHLDTATSYISIGLIYNEQGEHSKALELLQKALDVRETVLGINHPSTKKLVSKIETIKKLLNNEASTKKDSVKTTSYLSGIPLNNQNEKWGFINQLGDVVIPCQWKDAYPFSEGSACVQDNKGKWGFIDKTGKAILGTVVKY